MKSGHGFLRRNRTRCASTASTAATCAFMVEEATPLYRSKENFTSSALNASPLWNFTPLRSTNSYVNPSLETVQDSARLGAIAWPGMGFTSPSWSAYRIMKGVMMPVVSAGSNHAGASEAWTAHVIVPSGTAAVAGAGAPLSTDANANIKHQRGRAVIDAPFATVSVPCIANEFGRPDSGQGARLVLVRHVSGDPDGADHGPPGVADQPAARRRDHPSLRHGVERREKGLLLGLLGDAARQRAGADAHPERAPGLSHGDLGANDTRAIFPRECFQVPATVEDGHGQRCAAGLARLPERRFHDHRRLLQAQLGHVALLSTRSHPRETCVALYASDRVAARSCPPPRATIATSRVEFCGSGCP